MFRYVPNALTVARFPAAALMLVLYSNEYYVSTGVVAMIASLTDYADGYLARLWKVESDFGRMIDPYGDKAICWTGTIIVLWSFGADWLVIIPAVIGIGTYDFGLGILRFAYRDKVIPTSRFAKQKTTLLMIGLILLYMDFLVASSLPTVFYLAGLLTLWIAVGYAVRAAAHYLEAYGMPYVPRYLL